MGARDKIVSTLIDLAKPARQIEPVGFAPGSIARLDQTFQPIKTWHASPYDFDAVNLSRSGTGQGASMYGHGFYSAQSPEVSGPGGAYWHEFTNRRFNDFVPQLDQFDRNIEKMAADILAQNKFDRQAAANDARKSAEAFRLVQPDHPRTDQLERVADKLESGRQVGARVYETHLYARPEDYLDWDRPLTMQSKGVQEKLQDVGGWSTPYRTDWRGEDIYKSIADFAGGGPRGKKVATESLADVSIPGVRYLDQHSRNAWGAQQSILDINREIEALQTDLMNPVHSASKAKDIQSKIDSLDWERNIYADQVNKATYNYVTGNTDIIDLAKKLAVPGAAVPIGGLAAQDQYQ